MERAYLTNITTGEASSETAMKATTHNFAENDAKNAMLRLQIS
jgi:hypothetical protein